MCKGSCCTSAEECEKINKEPKDPMFGPQPGYTLKMYSYLIRGGGAVAQQKIVRKLTKRSLNCSPTLGKF
jgi:hypothetical protein